jgi:hypothetical protein
MMNQTDLRYPIGTYEPPAEFTATHIDNWIDYLSTYPKKIHELTFELTDEELNYRYRPEGWTIRQVLHHLPDSHTNAYIRFKLGLTEDTPTIRPYLEDRWAELSASKIAPIQSSLHLLAAVHAHWTILLRYCSPEDFERQLYHPESKETDSLVHYLGRYVWHSRHHLAHIQQALAMGNEQ